MDLTAESIEKIQKLSKVEVLVINDRGYTDRRVVPVLEPVPEILTLNTLTGLVDYVTESIDELNIEKMMVQVVDPKTVHLVSALHGEFLQRDTTIEAKACLNDPFAFGRYHDLEDFIISLQAKFVRSVTVDQILGYVTNVTSDASVKQKDDGITQRTTIKTGVALREEADVPNPVTLAPFRTFLEVNQPESQYVFRIKNNQGVSGALFEAGGGMWKLEAIEGIREWLVDNLPDGLKVIA